MRVLCCLDGTNSEQLSKAASSFLSADALTLGLMYVTDTGPHKEMERQRERFLRPRATGPLREQQIRQVEEGAAQEILEEGRRYLPEAELLRRTGRPEREIVNAAAEWNADVIVLCPRSPHDGGPMLGPKSVGHVARFVLDHAPCPVLLVRPLARGEFPIAR